MRRDILMAAILICLLVTHPVLADSYSCLELTTDGIKISALDMNSGYVRTITLPDVNPYSPGHFVALTISPDGRYAAYIQPDGPIAENSTGTLLIAPRNTLGALGVGVVVQTHVIVPTSLSGGVGSLSVAHDEALIKRRSNKPITEQLPMTRWTSETELIWSADSQTLLYHWETLGSESYNDPHQQFAALATLSGKTKQLIALPSASAVAFNGVAADGTYVLLAIYQVDAAGKEQQYGFLKTSSLSFHYVLSPGQIMDSINCPDLYLIIWNCSIWSPMGHRVVLSRFEDNQKVSLFVIDPTEPTVTVALFTTSTNYYYLLFAGWSPDGMRFATFTQFDSQNTKIDVWSIGHHEHTVVTYTGFWPLNGDGFTPVRLNWCDKNNLHYWLNTGTPKTGYTMAQLADFSVLAKQRRLISPPILYYADISSTVIVGCTDTYTLQSGSDTNGDYVRVVDGVSNRQSLLINHKVDAQEWFGQVAVASWSGGIAWMNGDGSGRREIDLDGKIMPQMVSGNWLTFSAVHQGSDPGSAELYLVNLVTSQYQKVLTESTATPPTGYFSPDNKALLVLDSDFAGGISVMLDNDQVGNMQTFSRQPLDFTPGVQTSNWSPDNALVAILTSDANYSDAVVDVFQRDGTFVRRFDQLIVSDNEQPPTLTWVPTCNP